MIAGPRGARGCRARSSGSRCWDWVCSAGPSPGRRAIEGVGVVRRGRRPASGPARGGPRATGVVDEVARCTASCRGGRRPRGARDPGLLAMAAFCWSSVAPQPRPRCAIVTDVGSVKARARRMSCPGCYPPGVVLSSGLTRWRAATGRASSTPRRISSRARAAS